MKFISHSLSERQGSAFQFYPHNNHTWVGWAKRLWLAQMKGFLIECSYADNITNLPCKATVMEAE